MKVLVNGKKETISFMGETLGDLLSHIEKVGVAQGNVVRSIKIDGQESSPDSSEAQRTQISEIATLEVEISTLADMINKNIENADAYLIRLIPGIEQSVELFRIGNEQEANKFFVKIVDGIDWFSQVLDIILTAKEISPETVFEGKSIQANHGIVTGSPVRARHIGTDILATLKNIVGGELKSYSILLTAAREEAMERMIAQATELNANAIINFRFQTSTIAPGASEVIAYGTAVTFSD